MINTAKIKERMKEIGITQRDMAHVLGISEPAVSQKLNNQKATNLKQAKTIAEMLNIKNYELKAYFFM